MTKKWRSKDLTNNKNERKETKPKNSVNEQLQCYLANCQLQGIQHTEQCIIIVSRMLLNGKIIIK